jgi:DHA2 family multidrug resistance protein
MVPLNLPKGLEKWLITLSVMITTVMEIIDTTVVTVAVPHIQGSLSAGLEEVTWVLTSYLVANGIIIPLTGWLTSLFGRKGLLLFSVSLFTFSSFLCGSAPSLGLLVLFRILQGIGGGPLIATSQAVLMETFPPTQQGVAMAIYGIGIMFGPIFGPILGGWITDNYTWRWAFYINIPIGMLALLLIYIFVSDPPYLKRQSRSLANIDYIGLILLCVGLGCLQVMLDKGELEDWFSSPFIVRLAIISGIALVAVVIWELRSKNPIILLRLFKDSTYSLGCLLVSMHFFALLGSIVLLPVYLQKLMGYDATKAGFVLGPGGIASLIAMIIVGRLVNLIDTRILIGIGACITSYGLYLMSGFNLQIDFNYAMWTRLIHGFGLGFIFVPVSTTALGRISKENMGHAASLFNMLRNIGGSIGVAVVTTYLSRRSQFHQNILVSHISPTDLEALGYTIHLDHTLSTRGPDTYTAYQQTLGLIYGAVLRQSKMMAFNDNFLLLSILYLCFFPFLLFMRGKIGRREGISH